MSEAEVDRNLTVLATLPFKHRQINTDIQFVCTLLLAIDTLRKFSGCKPFCLYQLMKRYKLFLFLGIKLFGT